MSVTLALTAAILFGIGTYLVLQHTLTRILIGIALVTHGANVLLMGAGRRGTPAIIGAGDPADFSDPLPQALALTAIVISFGVSALLLALAYRSWLLTHDDEVQDDVADRAIAVGGLADKEVGDEERWHDADVGVDPDLEGTDP
jgi:multicomponent Na+:H+ antiporter subunit C